jgi:site-specific recombinase XerD
MSVTLQLRYSVSSGKWRLRTVTTEHIERCLASLRRAGLSPRSVEHVRSVLRNAFNTAMKWYKLSREPREGRLIMQKCDAIQNAR